MGLIMGFWWDFKGVSMDEGCKGVSVNCGLVDWLIGGCKGVSVDGYEGGI